MKFPSFNLFYITLEIIPNYCLTVSDTYFMVGTGPRPSGYGTQLGDETGSLRPLAAYNGRTVVLSLPPQLDLLRQAPHVLSVSQSDKAKLFR